MEDNTDTPKFEVSLLDLPDEVIQYILRLLPPYNDLKNCMQVCKRLHVNVQSVLNYTQISFKRAIADFNIQWDHNIEKSYNSTSITKRYSHSACYHDNSMYIFGGCSFSSTTFNDLWRLDLSTRQWHRLPTSGSYPSPKACASLIPYKDSLILFGGIAQPSLYPLHQSWPVFNELHVFNTSKSSWTAVKSDCRPPPLAFHSVTIHQNFMVLFGGVGENNISSNEVWSLDMDTMKWRHMCTAQGRPSPRYGVSQVYIDRYHLLIIGGCAGVARVFTDAWLLNMTNDDLYVWIPVTIGNEQSAAPHLFCQPAVRINSRYVITFGRNPKLKYRTITVESPLPLVQQIPNRRNNMIDDCDVNVNGRRGELNYLRRRHLGQDIPNPNLPDRLVAFHCPSAKLARQRERQLEVIQRYEKKLMRVRSSIGSSNISGAGGSSNSSSAGSSNNSTPSSSNSSPASDRPISPTPQPHTRSCSSCPFPSPKESRMAMFVLDISRALENYVEWKSLKHIAPNSPEPCILYSLVLGRGEVIMFGGIFKDMTNVPRGSDIDHGENQVSDALHFITPPTVVI